MDHFQLLSLNLFMYIPLLSLHPFYHLRVFKRLKLLFYKLYFNSLVFIDNYNINVLLCKLNICIIATN